MTDAATDAKRRFCSKGGNGYALQPLFVTEFSMTLGAPAVFPFLVLARACTQGWCWPQDAIVPLGGLVGVAIAATIGIRKWKTGGLGKYAGALWVVVFVHPFVLWPLHQALPTRLGEQTAYLVGAILLATISAALVLTGIWVLRTILKRE